MNKSIVMSALALASLAGCAPPAKTPSDWNAKIAPIMEERKPKFAECFKQEQARVAAFDNSDGQKKMFQEFLSHQVVIVTYLEITGMGDGDVKTLKSHNGYGTVTDGETLLPTGGAHGHGDVDGPLHQCVENAMSGITPWDKYYPSRGAWKVIFQPGK